MTTITITLPTIVQVGEVLLNYILIGMIPWIAHCVSYVWCDYGRTVNKLPLWQLLIVSIADLILWPLNISNTRDNLKGFNRDINYYR